MESYKIIAGPSGPGWSVSCPAFNITIDAADSGDLDAAVAGLKRLMADEANARLERGDFLPASEPIDPGWASSNGQIVLYVETDFSGQFIAKTSETVRRNVSMPAWMDLRLRRNNIDASRLFQDAAIAKLAEMEATGKGLRRINAVRDLEDACAPGVLDDYFERRMERMMREHFGKGGM